MNMDEYLKMLKRMEKIANTPNFKKALETNKKIEQMIDPEWIKKTERVQNTFSKTGLSSYVNQINRMQCSMKSIEFIDMNQDFYKRIQSLQDKLNYLMPDLTNFYSNKDEINDEEVETLQTDYSVLMTELESFPKQELSEEQRNEMVQKLEAILDDIQAPSDITSTELNNVVEENNREHEHDITNQDDRENQQSETSRTNDGNPVYIFIQSALSCLKDPEWQGEKLSEFLVSNGYGLAYVLLSSAKSGEISIFSLIAAFGLLTILFRKNE